jgi:hypothetical protein
VQTGAQNLPPSQHSTPGGEKSTHTNPGPHSDELTHSSTPQTGSAQTAVPSALNWQTQKSAPWQDVWQ